ncbi:MAG: hypothetical protein ACM3UU_05085 [Ignavibacteriales bacterium]
MNKTKVKRKLKVTRSLSIFLCLIGFFLFLGVGLITVDCSFNNLTGRKNNTPIFAFIDQGNGKYNIAIFGKKQELNIKRTREIIESTGHFIKSTFNEEKIKK